MPRRKEILMLFKSGVQLFNFHIKKTVWIYGSANMYAVHTGNPLDYDFYFEDKADRCLGMY